jgi:uncharacterized protein (DUF2237 family)
VEFALVFFFPFQGIMVRSRGNDLSAPRPESGFPGLRPGDRWCLCALRWKEALEAGVAPSVVLAASHEAALRYVTIEVLNQHAIDGRNMIHKPKPEK